MHSLHFGVLECPSYPWTNRQDPIIANRIQ